MHYTKLIILLPIVILSSCSSKTTCQDGFTGNECSQCMPGYFGANCMPCACVHGECADGLFGDGSCKCNEHWAGENCDNCAEKFWGPSCDKTTSCQHGTASSGIDGDGHCLECKPGYWGIDCAQKNSCLFGIPNEGISGDGFCLECIYGYFGKNCDLHPTCLHGEAKIGINGDGHCLRCLYGYTGLDCDICQKNYFGNNCQPCNCPQNTYCNDGPDGDGSCYIKDSADNKYSFVRIGYKKYWMAENLRFQNRDVVCYPPNYDPNLIVPLGCLYTWDDAQNICPTGWRLPTVYEFQELLNLVKTNKTSTAAVSTSLMAKSEYWYPTIGEDEFGFNALPSGSLRDEDSFLEYNNNCYLWSSTSRDNYEAHFLLIDFQSSGTSYASKSLKNAVRCINDL